MNPLSASVVAVGARAITYVNIYTSVLLLTFRLRSIYAPPQVLFKMDNEGHGQEIQLRNLAANTPLSLCNWKNSMVI